MIPDLCEWVQISNRLFASLVQASLHESSLLPVTLVSPRSLPTYIFLSRHH